MFDIVGMIAWIISTLMGIFILVLFVYIIVGWLINFGIVNRHNKVVDFVLQIGQAVTEPVLRPVRSVIPPFSGIDLSPIFVIVGLQAIQIFILGPLI